MNKFTLFTTAIILIMSCSNSSGKLLEGKYTVGDVSFQESVAMTKQIELINSMHDIIIEGNDIMVTPDSVYRYSLRDGILRLKSGKKTYKLECEDFSTDHGTVYKLFLGTEYIKSITIMERNK